MTLVDDPTLVDGIMRAWRHACAATHRYTFDGDGNCEVELLVPCEAVGEHAS